MADASKALNEIPLGVVLPASEFAMRVWFEAVLTKFPQCRQVYGGILSNVQDLFSHCGRSPALHASLSAVSLGMISRRVKQDYLSAKALASYGIALTAIQKAINDPQEAKSDETLLAILMLSFYETLICASRDPIAWASHVRGAATVIRLRGSAQLRDDQGLKLFQTFHDQYLWSGLSGLGTDSDIPLVPELCDEFQDFQEENMPLNRIRGKSNKLLMLQTRLRNLELETLDTTAEAVSEIATAINDLDEELGEWTETVPDEWYCSVMPFEAETMKSDDIGTDHALIYSSIWVATFWNSYRSLRIFAGGLLERCVRLHRTVDPAADDLIFENKPSSKDLAEDICASVPFFLGYTGGNGERKFPYPQHIPQRPAYIVCAYQLMWPLYVAGSVQSLPLERRRWVARRLAYIGHSVGIKQAVALSERVGVY
ncbi:hypothetical protein NA57DRAFT_70782 [Rhizodiscina lignyota]|uniref:Uncharacterized protein n=1 Tax=Rhizodiscina lignyota TaxID=1504668 RepID=A0A9P4MEL0_9PEZI|nr:hypothetical protein NA57DRAFT_70782 [Rhizodiscina lignyota]